MNATRRAFLAGIAAAALGLGPAPRLHARGKPEITVYKDPT